jgi:hypothetical protein
VALTDQQLAVILQACIEHAKTRLEEQGGFLPFGARARPDGEIEFIEARDTGEGESLDAVYQRISALVAEAGRANEIVAGALVANAGLPEGAIEAFETAITVQLEAPGFCRGVIAPYRLTGDGQRRVELGDLLPDVADPVIFAG